MNPAIFRTYLLGTILMEKYFFALKPTGSKMAKPSSSLRVLAPTLQPSLGNVRTARRMTCTVASKPATETKPREPRGIMKPRRVSPKMQAFLSGVSEIPRTQLLKEIWAYIKKHELQVYCTDGIRKVKFGNYQILRVEERKTWRYVEMAVLVTGKGGPDAKSWHQPDAWIQHF